MIKVVFFAALREQLDCSALQIAASEVNTIGDIKTKLADKNEHWQQVFSNGALLCAINHDMVEADTEVKSGDEVAFFPPVTGG
jgi:molybdopterin synthase sulfur carrier subunit